jgi:hypothetical protein
MKSSLQQVVAMSVARPKLSRAQWPSVKQILDNQTYYNDILPSNSILEWNWKATCQLKDSTDTDTR